MRHAFRQGGHKGSGRDPLRGDIASSFSSCMSFWETSRATLIPTLAVPVVILGTFAVLGDFGFSINMLTMFAMGGWPSDSWWMTPLWWWKNVERVMAERGCHPKKQTRKSMEKLPAPWSA